MLDAKWVVQIYANNKNGASCIGTGYAIDDRHILTASHVLFFDGRADNPEFKLVWSEKDGNGELIIKDKKPIYDVDKKAMFFNEKDIVFNSDIKELDLAVIRCPNALLFKPPKVLLANNLPKNEWKTKGFPRVGKVEDKRNLTGFTVKSEDETGNILSVSISVNPDEGKFEKTEKVWGGLSGAPVFSDNKLIAVITNSHDKLENYFYATSIPWVQQYRKDFCEAIKPEFDELGEKQKLNNAIKAAIKPLLKSWGAIEELKNTLLLDDDKTVDDIANCLIDVNVIKSITSLTKSLKEYKELSNPDLKKWDESVKRAGKIGGWLLIKTVNLSWWFNNEQLVKQNITGKFSLDNPDYIEVIISRSFLQSAEYVLDIGESGTGKVKPNAKSLPFFAYDGGQNAIDEQWLHILYKDLHGEHTKFNVKKPENFIEEILQSIKSRVKANFNIKEKITYYLINSDNLTSLESTSWFKKAQTDLAGYLQFICCGEKNYPDQEHSVEDQTQLLEQLAVLLNMANEK